MFLGRFGLSFEKPEHTDSDLSPDTASVISNFMGAGEETAMVSHSWTCVCPLRAGPLLKLQPQATVCVGDTFILSSLTAKCHH